jgi:hypothetical protein
MSMKKLIIPLIVIAGIIVLFIRHDDKVAFDRSHPVAEMPPEYAGGASGQFARVQSNSLVMTDQLPGDRAFINTVFNEKPGFVIIQKDEAGNPGAIIGVSKWLGTGDNSRLEILLSEKLIDGLPYYAMLYADDGNGLFDPKDDHVVYVATSPKTPLLTTFHADKKAENPRDIEINF